MQGEARWCSNSRRVFCQLTARFRPSASYLPPATGHLLPPALPPPPACKTGRGPMNGSSAPWEVLPRSGRSRGEHAKQNGTGGKWGWAVAGGDSRGKHRPAGHFPPYRFRLPPAAASDGRRSRPHERRRRRRAAGRTGPGAPPAGTERPLRPFGRCRPGTRRCPFGQSP